MAHSDDAGIACEWDVTKPVAEPANEQPHFTEAALAAAEQPLLAVVKCHVTEAGTVKDCRVFKSAHPDLDRSALEVLPRWKMKPAARHGQPIATDQVFNFLFQRPRSTQPAKESR